MSQPCLWSKCKFCLAPGTITRCQGLTTLITSSPSRNPPWGSSAAPALVKGRGELAVGHA